MQPTGRGPQRLIDWEATLRFLYFPCVILEIHLALLLGKILSAQRAGFIAFTFSIHLGHNLQTYLFDCTVLPHYDGTVRDQYLSIIHVFSSLPLLS